MRLSGDKFSPWAFSSRQHAGDGLKTTLTFDVPTDFPPGPATFALLIARNVPGEGWQYARILDPAGTPSGDAFRHPVQVRGGADPRPRARPLVVRTMPAPHLDGKLEKGEWRDATKIGTLAENIAGGTPHAATEVVVGHGTTELYIAFRCQEPKLPSAVRTRFDKHDGPVWNNECVEVFLDPDADRVSYMHFLVDLLGQRHDLLGSDSHGFNPKWRAQVAEGKDRWSVEIAIPFSSLGASPPQPGTAWYGNFCRERKVVNELSAWQPTGGSFAAPGRFGLLVFDSLRQYLVHRAADLEAGTDWPPELREPLNRWRGRLDAWRRRLRKLPRPGVDVAWSEMTTDLEALRNDLTRLRRKAAAIRGQGVLVTEADPYAPFRGVSRASEKPIGPVDRTVLLREWLDLAWNVTNPTNETLTLRCQLRHGDPKAPYGYLAFGLPGVEGRWRLATPVAAGDDRPIYDALAPLPAGTFTVPPGQTAQVWLSLCAKAPLPDGRVNGYLRIERIDGGRGDPVTARITLRVLPRDIRMPGAVHGFTWNYLPEAITSDRAWLEAHYHDLRDHGVDVALISGLRHLPRVKANPDGSLTRPLDFGRLDAFLAGARPYFRQYYVSLDIWEKRYLRHDLFGLPFDSPVYEKAFRNWFRAVLDHLLAEGLGYEQFIINPYDESVGDACRKLAGWIKAVDPKVRVVIDCSTPDVTTARRMDALTDVWVPHYKVHFAEEMNGFFNVLEKSRKPHWCYFYSEGSNDKGQDPARHYQAKFWWAYQAGVTGVCYWAQQYYGDPWYRAAYKAAYDTSLVYPAPGTVVASRRWEAWRRGWQDYQLLALTKAALTGDGKETERKKLVALVKDVVSFPGDPRRAKTARTWLRKQLAAGMETVPGAPRSEQ